MNGAWLKKLSINNHYSSDNKIIELSKKLALIPYLTENIANQNIDTSIFIIQHFLADFDSKYLKIFNDMLTAENIEKPNITIFNSTRKDNRNESFTSGHEIFFYKTDTIKDPPLLLHEFTHYLINYNKLAINDKKSKEIAPILSEFIIGDKEYLKERLNTTIMDAKSLVIKYSIINGNYNLKELFNKYNLTPFEQSELISDINSRGLNFDSEVSYIYGTLYAYYFSKANKLDNYRNLIMNKNISLVELDTNIVYELYDYLNIKPLTK